MHRRVDGEHRRRVDRRQHAHPRAEARSISAAGRRAAIRAADPTPNVSLRSRLAHTLVARADVAERTLAEQTALADRVVGGETDRPAAPGRSSAGRRGCRAGRDGAAATPARPWRAIQRTRDRRAHATSLPRPSGGRAGRTLRCHDRSGNVPGHPDRRLHEPYRRRRARGRGRVARGRRHDGLHLDACTSPRSAGSRPLPAG